MQQRAGRVTGFAAWTALALGTLAAGCSLFVNIPDLTGGSSESAGDGGDVSVTNREAAAETGSTTTTDGEVADVGVVSDARASVYAQTVLADMPMAYWRFDEVVGPTAFDSSPNHTNGTYVGDITYGLPGAIVNDPNEAAGFEGGFMTAGNQFDFVGTAAFSLEAWVMGVTDTNYHSILGCDEAVSQQVTGGYLLILEPMGTAPLDFSRTQSSSDTDYANTWTLNWSTSWTHVVVTYDTQTIVIYVNGVSQVAQQSTAILTAPTNPFSVGGDQGGPANPFDGVIDEVAVYDHPLTSARVSLHYNAGIGM